MALNPVKQKPSHPKVAAAFFAALLAMGSTTIIADPDSTRRDNSIEQRLKESWRHGSVQASFLMSKYLNPLDIDVSVIGDEATLTGHVDSEASKALATEVALSVEGIENVDNRLKVDPARAQRADTRSELGRAISDTAITAKVKARLLAKSDVSGTEISVETNDGVVVLTGEVDSEVHGELAYYVARNTDGVQVVENKLRVKD